MSRHRNERGGGEQRQSIQPEFHGRAMVGAGGSQRRDDYQRRSQRPDPAVPLEQRGRVQTQHARQEPAGNRRDDAEHRPRPHVRDRDRAPVQPSGTCGDQLRECGDEHQRDRKVDDKWMNTAE